MPVISAHDYNGEALDLASLNQGDRFEHFIERSRATWQNNERVGIFHQQRFADKKVVHRDEAIEIAIWLLLHRQLNIATDGTAAHVFGAAVRRFHDSGSAAGHYP